MLKLVKYELRGNLFAIVGICITVIIANLILLTRRGTWGIQVVGTFSLVLAIAAIITIFIFSLTIMSKYLHEDSGYLMFTLPQSGASIIMSRLITALIQITIVILVSFSSLYLIAGEDMPFEFVIDSSIYGTILIEYIWATVIFLTFIYFCMIIGKVAFGNKKIGKLGSFITFLLLSFLTSWITQKITILFPQTIALNNLDIFSLLKINIASWIFDICTFTIYFISSSYLLDKKVDL